MADNQLIEAAHIAGHLGVADLKSAHWDKASPVKLDRYWSGEPAPAGRHAEARILWSEIALHVRFVCPQAEPLVVNANPQTAKKSIGLWDRDVCEIFIAPDPSQVERYLEFEAAPNGEWLDVAIHWRPEERESDWEFSSGMTVAARVEENRMRVATRDRVTNASLKRVTIAMRIPWNHWIHEPQKGERWRVNLFRCVGKDPGRGYLAWQPTRTKEPNFHVPQAFGWLLFN
jgi:hypothetical protein